MKIISSEAHGVLDYAVVAYLWLSPTLFNLSDHVSIITYIIGGVHLVLTLFTNFDFGLIKVISFKLHGQIELIVSLLLVATPWVLGFNSNYIDCAFYLSFGIVVFFAWLLTDYSISGAK